MNGRDWLNIISGIGAVALVITVIFVGIITANAMSVRFAHNGVQKARDSAEAAFYRNCRAKFNAGSYDEACVAKSVP